MLKSHYSTTIGNLKTFRQKKTNFSAPIILKALPLYGRDNAVVGSRIICTPVGNQKSSGQFPQVASFWEMRRNPGKHRGTFDSLIDHGIFCRTIKFPRSRDFLQFDSENMKSLWNVFALEMAHSREIFWILAMNIIKLPRIFLLKFARHSAFLSYFPDLGFKDVNKTRIR